MSSLEVSIVAWSSVSGILTGEFRINRYVLYVWCDSNVYEAVLANFSVSYRHSYISAPHLDSPNS